MKKFIATLAMFFLLLLLMAAIPTILYIKSDVYADFGKKENYSWKYSFQSLGDINTKKLISRNTDYNSFVFGSSRATSAYACYLQSIIPNSTFFHYANWNESISGIERKLVLLDSLGYHINNAIVYLDNDYTFANGLTSTADDHHLLSHESQSKYLIGHYRSFFKHFSYDKLRILLGLQPSSAVFPNWVSDLHTNDPNHICSASTISSYGINDQPISEVKAIDSLIKTGFFYERPIKQAYSQNQILDPHKLSLKNMRRIFEKHQTKYYVIITPLYDQIKFSANDHEALLEQFGTNLYDFSGISEVTNSAYNYPDRKHFKNHISKMILDSVVTRK